MISLILIFLLLGICLLIWFIEPDKQILDYKIVPREYCGKIGRVDQYGDFGYIAVYEEIDDKGKRISFYTESKYKIKFGDRKPDYVRNKSFLY